MLTILHVYLSYVNFSLVGLCDRDIASIDLLNYSLLSLSIVLLLDVGGCFLIIDFLGSTLPKTSLIRLFSFNLKLIFDKFESLLSIFSPLSNLIFYSICSLIYLFLNHNSLLFLVLNIFSVSIIELFFDIIETLFD